MQVHSPLETVAFDLHVMQLFEAVPLHVAHLGLQASQLPVEIFMINPSWQVQEWGVELEQGVVFGLQVIQLPDPVSLQVAQVLSQGKQNSPEL